MNTAPRLLITRPAGQGEALMQAAEQRGWLPVAVPLLALEPLSNEVMGPSARRIALQLDRYEHLIFVSTNAVHYGLHYLEQFWPQWPQGSNWFAIGTATADALRQWQIEPVEIQGTMTSEELLRHPLLQQVDGEVVLFVKGEGGRDTMAQTLRQRGARTESLHCYRRLCPDHAGRLQQALQAPLAAVLVASGETLANLAQLARSIGALPILQGYPLVVPSARVAAQARALGFSRISVAANAADQNMLAAAEPFRQR